jgi:tRNA A-37 threonylcarbamoyl transferase component Bud32
MAMRIVANRPDPAILGLPWHLPLEEWPDDVVVPLPRGLSRHIVRIVRLGDRVYAVKETQDDIAFREYRLLRDLQRIGMPAVVPQGVVTGRESADGEELPAALITRHLQFSLPYRSLFSRGMTAEQVPTLIDAIVVLLVRLHLAGFYWGDVSLSNVLFRRNAGEFSAYLVDAETGELRDEVGERMREYDITVGCENIFAELMDLEASGAVHEIDGFQIIEHLRTRYEALWGELTGLEEFRADEMWRIEQRVERLNELGFDVDELDIVTDLDGDTIRIQPKVVDLGHHAREIQALTGMSVEENQARRLLNDLAAFTAHFDLGREDRHLVASKWMHSIFEPIMAMIPPDASGKLEPAEVFHEILEHRWYLSEQAGQQVDIFDTARDYIDRFLTTKPDEAITGDEAVTDPE